MATKRRVTTKKIGGDRVVTNPKFVSDDLDASVLANKYAAGVFLKFKQCALESIAIGRARATKSPGKKKRA
jgi:hypothetical protein